MVIQEEFCNLLFLVFIIVICSVKLILPIKQKNWNSINLGGNKYIQQPQSVSTNKYVGQPQQVSSNKYFGQPQPVSANKYNGQPQQVSSNKYVGQPQSVSTKPLIVSPGIDPNSGLNDVMTGLNTDLLSSYSDRYGWGDNNRNRYKQNYNSR